jgi:hypothetical protein
MIDTIILSIPREDFVMTKEPEAANWELNKKSGNFEKYVKNQTVSQRRDGIYRPRIRLIRRITKEVYDTKLKEYKEKQCDINIRLEEYTRADENFHLVASMVFSLANRALEIFESSEVNEKRQLLNFLLQNCRLQDKKLLFELRSPFNDILKYAHYTTLLRR